MDLKKLAIDIISQNKFLTLATSDNNISWASTVYYCIDNNFNFYFSSQMSTLHVKNILNNPSVAFSIFDHKHKEAGAVGVQIKAKAVVIKEQDLDEALRYYKSDFVTPERLKSGEYHLFKLTPENIYATDPDANVDIRVEVELKK